MDWKTTVNNIIDYSENFTTHTETTFSLEVRRSK
jgi:hypothetical protein